MDAICVYNDGRAVVPDECEAAIPTVSKCGLVVMTLLVFTAGAIVFGSGKNRCFKEGKMGLRKLGTLRSLALIVGLGASALSARASEPFLVKDINPGADSSSPMELTAVNGVLLFSADDGTGTSRRELWISDGTAAGTVAGFIAFGIGSETGGSIVYPCSAVGATGLRPTLGRVSPSPGSS